MDENAILGIACRWAPNLKDEHIRAANGNGVKVVPLLCAGNILPATLMEFFTKGGDAVFLLGCDKETCKYPNGEDKARGVVEATQIMLEDFGVEPERIMYVEATDEDEDPLGRAIREARKIADELGPNPLK